MRSEIPLHLFHVISRGLTMTILILYSNSAKTYRTHTSQGNKQANWQSFLREHGWKCKALQSQLEHLCILQNSVNLPREKLAVKLRW